ncbi:Reverse transcriptase RNA-dependent DNA polymerase [Arabidopsis suecica]|uniref:Reverse transcriptase RNA-dependent DNA polymerase n=1 Tax=Arabidopsis suecica TaxID=45249 RepID=A0A8T2CJU0_ARASU|nr:Reverse transcriptase RNA-dependent DNA polymerase [Arabidopsis suecica]
MEDSSETFSAPTVTISQCVTLKLNETNYLLWKLQFEQFLASQMLLSFVNGGIPRPPPTLTVQNGDLVTETSNPAFVKWISSHEVWLALAKKYNRVSATRKLDLQRKIHSTTKLGKTMSLYLAEIKSLCDQLDSIGSPISEYEKISGALSGLGKEYESVTTVIEESMETYPGPCFEDVAQLTTLSPMTTTTTTTEEATTTDVVTPTEAVVRIGVDTEVVALIPHVAEVFNNSSALDLSLPIALLVRYVKNLVILLLSAIIGLRRTTTTRELAQALTAMRLSDEGQVPGHPWVTDSGATAYITNSAASLQTAQPYAGEETVIVGYGDFLPITHVGSTVLQGKTPLLSAWQSSFTPPEQASSSTVPVTRETENSECTIGNDPTSIGNNSQSFPSPLPTPDTPPTQVSDTSSNTTTATTSNHPMVTRAKSSIVKPNPKYAFFIVKENYPKPKTFKSALKDPGWNSAMGEEMTTMYEVDVSDLVPPDQAENVLGCRWIFKTKLHSDGSLDKLKARLVAKRYDQEEGVDFVETFSPVVRTVTVKSVLHVAVTKKWNIKQLDVKNEFLHGDLKKTVYMVQPPGFEDASRPDYVCKLKKAIYGLKQAPRAWFEKFSNYLLEFGFLCSVPYPSLFVYAIGKDLMYLLLYNDDMVFTGNNEQLIQRFLDCLNKEFRMKDMGPLHYFLGVQAYFHKDGLFLNKEKYAKDLLVNARMADCAPMPTPLPLQLDKVPGQNEIFNDPTYFRSLAGTIQLGVNINADTDSALRAYIDSDWAGCKETWRSTGGFCTFLGMNIISWSAKRHSTVSKSSTEAEYRTLSFAA